MKHDAVPVLALMASAAAGAADNETHAALQAVTATGTRAGNGAFPITLRCVLPGDPDEMLEVTPDFQSGDGGVNACT